MNPRRLLRTGLVLFLLFPFLFLLWRFPNGLRVDPGELWWAFSNSFRQAFGSATFSLVLGMIFFSPKVKRHWRLLFEILLLLPNFLPPLFVLLAVLNLVDPFPMGLPGMILVHTIMNWGLVAVSAARLIESRLGGMAELAWIEGASFGTFLKRVFFPLLWRDLGSLWLFVFVVCFSGFAVPLVVGGGRGTTLEVLIYEKIRFSTNWSEAVAIAAIQSLFLFGLSWVLVRGEGKPSSEARNLSLLRLKSGVVLNLLLSGLLLLGYFQGFPAGFSQIGSLFDLKNEIIGAFAGSLAVGLGTGVLCFLFLLSAAFL
ncbi:MAG TPA: iron ABC transporter permease, partial [Pseudobdellovibrionaceae bacterium]|nr:iron ABC transporter permease [Pseudobdellovibrionaceae bacterium]